MAEFKAKHQGHLEGYGLVCKGDIVEWNGSKRAWLEPLKGKVEPQTVIDRKAMVAELKAKGIKFYKGADNEYLAALLATSQKAMK
jgi:hypothetical protein